MTAHIIDLATRRRPDLHSRAEELRQEAEQILRKLEEVLGEHAMIGVAISGKDPDSIDDDLACRYMAAHTAGMLEAYAQRHRGAQATFEKVLKRKETRPPLQAAFPFRGRFAVDYAWPD